MKPVRDIACGIILAVTILVFTPCFLFLSCALFAPVTGNSIPKTDTDKETAAEPSNWRQVVCWQNTGDGHTYPYIVSGKEQRIYWKSSDDLDELQAFKDGNLSSTTAHTDCFGTDGYVTDHLAPGKYWWNVKAGPDVSWTITIWDSQP